MISFIAHTDGKVIIPDEPVELREGERFIVTLEPLDEDNGETAKKPGWMEDLAKLSEQMPDDLPEDLAEEHDHYIHGTPKRNPGHPGQG